jgi:hypothetical protein
VLGNYYELCFIGGDSFKFELHSINKMGKYFLLKSIGLVTFNGKIIHSDRDCPESMIKISDCDGIFYDVGRDEILTIRDIDKIL